MNNIAIKIENLSKQYRLGVVGTGTLSHDIKRWWIVNILGKEDPYLKIGDVNDREVKGSSKYVWALKGINLEIEKGDVIGIIGKNGAGKSTLLKLLSRVTKPTTGNIKYNGKIASLLEVGTGFHPEMTGRENIYMNGAIMGMTRSEITSKLDEIISFSGIHKYIDTPVKRYSSGMTVRLGFSIAAHLEPDILVVDEVLAVGDVEFQKKAIGKMKTVSEKGERTVLFVSHNMASIQNLCNKVCILEKGCLTYYGDTKEGIQKYLNQKVSNTEIELINREDRKGTGILKFDNVLIKNNGAENSNLQSGCVAEFFINFKTKKPATKVVVRLIVVDDKDIIRFVCNNYHSSNILWDIKEDGNIVLKIEKFPLPPGVYYYHLQGLSNGDIADDIEFAGKFYVENGDYFGTGKTPSFKEGLYINHTWINNSY